MSLGKVTEKAATIGIVKILSCFGEHAKGIALRALWRAARYMVRLGF